MNIHDSGYKRLFSDKTFFRQLIQTIVEEEWVQEVDFATAERVNKSFVSEHYKETESDLVYKVQWRNTTLYFYILLEFQSTVDPFMALRVLYYILGLYMDLRIAQPELERLPAVFPVVLYNGDRKWNAAPEIAELIEAQPNLGEQSIRFRYFKIAENEYALERLLRIRNLVSTLFLAETHFNLEQLVEEVTALFEQEEDKAAASLLANWLAQMAVHGRIEQEDFAQLERVYRNSLEVKTMLQTAIAKEKEEILQEGIQLGEARGKAEGIQLGEARGKAEGIQLGEAKGKRAQQRLTAQRMRQAGQPISLIAFVLEITETEVLTLLEETHDE